MTLRLKCTRLFDPDGHHPALLLKGDWLIVEISDGQYIGQGEASHSMDDVECEKQIARIFDEHISSMKLTLDGIRQLEKRELANARSFAEATAISGLNQALYSLLAEREGIPVWQLLSPKKCADEIWVYATINRALRSRTIENYLETIAVAEEQGFRHIKCAPFHNVAANGDQVEQSNEGLRVLQEIRRNFPDMSLRIDFHGRFRPETFEQILPAIESVSPQWIEEPYPLGPVYSQLRHLTKTQIAVGELYFGRTKFEEIAQNNWADVIMPDVKHVGGFGPLIDVAQAFSGRLELSPHNPSGPVSTAASLHAAAICPAITSLEVPLILDPNKAFYLQWMQAGKLQIPDGVGWGRTTGGKDE